MPSSCGVPLLVSAAAVHASKRGNVTRRVAFEGHGAAARCDRPAAPGTDRPAHEAPASRHGEFRAAQPGRDCRISQAPSLFSGSASSDETERVTDFMEHDPWSRLPSTIGAESIDGSGR